MKFELKNVKVMESLSEETYCFSATLYIDGERFCTVSNRGHGGCQDYSPLHHTGGRAMHDRIQEINAELGKETIDLGDDMTIENDLDIVTTDLVTEFLVRKDIKKSLRKICYLRDGDVWSCPAKLKPTPENIERVRNAKWWKPDYQILNNMAIDKLIPIFRG